MRWEHEHDLKGGGRGLF